MRYVFAMILASFLSIAARSSVADSIAPKYRLEAIGIQGPWNTGTRIHFVEETGGTTTMGMHHYLRRGTYRMETRQVETDVIENWLIQDGDETNLLPQDIAANIRFEDFNAAGQVVGGLRSSQPNQHFVFDTRSGTQTYLPYPVEPGAGTNVDARGINNLGNVVGNAYEFVPYVGWRIVGRYLWESPEGIPTRIDDRIIGLGDWYDFRLHDIADDGTIYGFGFNGEYMKRGEFKLVPFSASELIDEELVDFESGTDESESVASPDPIPVPEPSTWMILAASSALIWRTIRKGC